MRRILARLFFVFSALVVWGTIGDLSAALDDPVQLITHLKRLYLDTEFVGNGQARAVIYHPDTPGYATAARELAAVLEKPCGIVLAIESDTPKKTWRTDNRNIIVLGNPGCSLLLRSLFYRSLIRPGRTTRRIRTIHDPWADGRNVVMVGGADVGKVKENFPHLLKLLETPCKGTVLLPPTSDPCPPLTEDYKDEFADRRKDWDRMPNNYMHYYAMWAAVGYARCGNSEFVEMYRDAVLRMARNSYFSHLYIYRDFQYWDMIEESTVLTDADRLTITNYFHNAIASEKEGIGYVRRNTGPDKLLQHNHPTQGACAVLALADYFRRYYPTELHESWYRAAREFFGIYDTLGCTVLDEQGLQFASVMNIMTAVKCSTEDPARHPFLPCTLERTVPCINNFGMNPAVGDAYSGFRTASEYFLEGARIHSCPEWLWMHKFMEAGRPDRRVRVPAESVEPSSGESAWWPLAFAPKQPEGFVGLQWARADQLLFSLAKPDWAKKNKVTVDDCFHKVAFRAGIGPWDDYLLLDGVSLKGHAYEDANGILEYSSLGRTFLVSFNRNYGTPLSANNVVSITVDGMSASPPLTAVRRSEANLHSFAGTRTVLYNEDTADWERSVLWLKNRFFVVFDRVIARRDGFHSAAGFWRLVGQCEEMPDGIRLTHPSPEGDVHFRLAVQAVDCVAVGDDEDPQASCNFWRFLTPDPPLDDVPHAIHILKAHKARQLGRGESFTMPVCFWASSPKRDINVTCASITPDALRLELDGKPMLAARGVLRTNGLTIDADMALLGEKLVCAVDCREMRVGDTVLFRSDGPVSFEWRPAEGAWETVARCATRAVLAGTDVTLPEGRSEHEVEHGSTARQLVAALGALRLAKDTAPVRHRPPTAQPLKIAATCHGTSPVLCGWTGRFQPGSPEVIVLGRQDGTVDAVRTEGLKPFWTYRCQGPVNSIDAGDLDGDGRLEVVVGSDDYHVHALDSDGQPRWKWKAPFDKLKATIMYCWWMWPEPFVRKVVVHDLDNDGKAEIITGAGMGTYALDGNGRLAWSYDSGSSHTPTMHAIAFADVDGDGREEPIGGASDMWYRAQMNAIGPSGKAIKTYRSDSWCSGVKTAIARDLNDDARKALLYGTRRGGVFCYPHASNSGKHWYQRFGDMVTMLATFKAADDRQSIAVAGGYTNWLTALDAQGERQWAVYFDTHVVALTVSSDETTLYVGCRNGSVYELSANGDVLRSIRLQGRPCVMLACGAGVVAATDQGTAYLLR